MKLPHVAKLGTIPSDDLLRLLEAALYGLRSDPPDSFTEDLEETKRELERVLVEAGL
jgi:hypothetical protein